MFSRLQPTSCISINFMVRIAWCTLTTGVMHHAEHFARKQHHHRCEHASMTGWAHLATAALAALHMGFRLPLASPLCTSHTQQGSVSLRLLDQGSGIRDQGRGIRDEGMCVACVACGNDSRRLEQDASQPVLYKLEREASQLFVEHHVCRESFQHTTHMPHTCSRRSPSNI